MKLSIINGSPRGKSSNSKVLTDRFQQGFCSVESHCDIQEYFIRSFSDPGKLIEVLENSDLAIVIFPLYTDAMPGIVKRFFEVFQGYTFQNTNLKLGFIVQSGFPEAHHSRYIKLYLNKLAKRIGIEYLGTIIKGGVEGIKAQPGWMTKRYLQLFYDLGQHLALDWEFSDDIARRLARPEHLSKFTLVLYRFFLKTRMATYFWDQQMKQNNAYENRFAQPYSKP
ncbi:MAG: NAD(P)H-dependent oxidoreductase [Bacteroidetes bacterium]|nr:NAD(P)H-dependent oxidoreductase [Bacteroidota bacterium]